MGRIFCTSLRGVWALVKKDLVDELRTRYAITSMGLFALTTLVMVSFSTGIFALDAGLHASFLWIIVFFSAMSALARSFIKEEEKGTASTLRLSASPEIIFTGKLLYNVILLLGLIVVVFPFYLFLMNLPPGGNYALVVVFLIIGSACLAGATTILAAMVSRAGAKNSLLPVLAFPVLLPVLLTAIRGTSIALAGGKAGGVSSELTFLFSYLVIIVTASLLLFPFVWED
ncbi:MAG: heme exporter protein CcmB [Bacillota bacterium]|nr:heme exporter protein CcmB [Bacillota bacterium]